MAEAAGLNPVQRGFDPRRGYCGAAYNRFTVPHDEEDPDDDPDEPEQPADGVAPTSHVPSASLITGRTT